MSEFEKPPIDQIEERPEHPERKSFWQSSHKTIAEILKDPTKEHTEKAKEIARIRLQYLASLYENPIQPPEPSDEIRRHYDLDTNTRPVGPGRFNIWQYTKPFSFYHHSTHNPIEIVNEGLIPDNKLNPEQHNPYLLRPGHPAAERVLKAADKFRRLTKKSTVGTNWIAEQPDTSLLKDYQSNWEGGPNLIVDPEYLHRQNESFYKEPDRYRGHPDVPGELLYPDRIPPRALIGIYYAIGVGHGEHEGSDLHMNMKSYVSRSFENQIDFEKIPNKKNREEIQKLIEFFNNNPEKAMPIMVDIQVDRKKDSISDFYVYRSHQVWP